MQISKKLKMDCNRDECEIVKSEIEKVLGGLTYVEVEISNGGDVVVNCNSSENIFETLIEKAISKATEKILEARRRSKEKDYGR